MGGDQLLGTPLSRCSRGNATGDICPGRDCEGTARHPAGSAWPVCGGVGPVVLVTFRRSRSGVLVSLFCWAAACAGAAAAAAASSVFFLRLRVVGMVGQ